MKYSREKDDTCVELAKLQSRLFERASKEGIPSAFFAKVFFNSKYCQMLDDLSYLKIYPSEDEIFEYVKNNVGMERGTIYPGFVMSWIGYLLREWAYTFSVRTKQITKKVTMRYLCTVYPPYHSLDIRKAIILIASDLHININESLQETTLRILKEIN